MRRFCSTLGVRAMLLRYILIDFNNLMFSSSLNCDIGVVIGDNVTLVIDGMVSLIWLMMVVIVDSKLDLSIQHSQRLVVGGVVVVVVDWGSCCCWLVAVVSC